MHSYLAGAAARQQEQERTLQELDSRQAEAAAVAQRLVEDKAAAGRRAEEATARRVAAEEATAAQVAAAAVATAARHDAELAAVKAEHEAQLEAVKAKVWRRSNCKQFVPTHLPSHRVRSRLNHCSCFHNASWARLGRQLSACQ